MLGGYPELDEVLAATRLQAEGVFELFKNFLEFGRIGDGDRLHAKFLDWIFQTLRHVSRQSMAFYRAVLLRLSLESWLAW